MEQFTQPLITLAMTDWLMISVAVVLIMSLFSFKHQRTLQQNQLLSMQSLQRDLRALANAAVGVGGRVLEIERHQRKHEAPPAPEHPTVYSEMAPVEYYNSSNQPYEQAIRMVHTGASIEDIVNVCGLSKSEAELVSMMHSLDKAS